MFKVTGTFPLTNGTSTFTAHSLGDITLLISILDRQGWSNVTVDFLK
jgi:hypothetical protein